MKSIITLSAILILTHCTPAWKTDLYKYANARSSFPHEFSDHFPSNLEGYEISETYFIAPENSDSINHPYLISTFVIDSIRLFQLKQRIGESDLTWFHPHDTSLIVIGDTLNYHSIPKGTPVPTFNVIEPHDSRLNDNYDLYIYEAKPGKYLRTENLFNNPNLPAQWRNGYSKGLAINSTKPQVIFWMIIW